MQTVNCKLKNELSDRFLNFAVNVIKLTQGIDKTYAGNHIGGQLMRSATSSGANYEEACGAESRADFVHKMQIVLKELRETVYWLRLLERSAILDSDKIKWFHQESKELCNIAARSVVTAKNNARKKEVSNE